MLERNRKGGLSVQPTVRDDFDEVLGWHGLVEWHCEGDPVLIPH